MAGYKENNTDRTCDFFSAADSRSVSVLCKPGIRRRFGVWSLYQGSLGIYAFFVAGFSGGM